MKNNTKSEAQAGGQLQDLREKRDRQLSHNDLSGAMQTAIEIDKARKLYGSPWWVLDTHFNALRKLYRESGQKPGAIALTPDQFDALMDMHASALSLLAERDRLRRALKGLEEELQHAFDDVPAGVDAWMAIARAALAEGGK